MKITRRSLFKTLAGAAAAFVAKPVLDLVQEPAPELEIFYTTDGTPPVPGAPGTHKLVPFWIQDTRWTMCIDEKTRQYLESIRCRVPESYAGAVRSA